ncbi:pyridoxamine 5'-phosphate oxidase family protein [Ciceribacter sp. L1K23]|uniref:pyridoxamine 5'-phosphate oxidase family protein n=1 Tax=Ciceribacter sp. L1K23 TaxID=2820276 RepID=UPI001B81E85D|nr:pyridoxamine 5'-phosphate oxidase family protein [Ciceribacter sp. L1K23]
MASFSEARETPVNQLWEEIDDIHAGMLGLQGEAMHMQPMAPFADQKTNTIWFFTKTDSELVQKLRPGSRAHFCVVGKDHDYHACLAGSLAERKDAAKIDEYWNSIVEAWYEGGKSDPKLTLVALHLDDGEIWASTGNPLKFGWEIAKANMNDEKTPDVGVHRHVSFA